MFLGIIDYYNEFVKNYGKIEALLTTFLNKNVFALNKVVEQEFSLLKNAMCTRFVLVVFDFTNTCALECDSFGKEWV